MARRHFRNRLRCDFRIFKVRGRFFFNFRYGSLTIVCEEFGFRPRIAVLQRSGERSDLEVTCLRSESIQLSNLDFAENSNLSSV